MPGPARRQLHRTGRPAPDCTVCTRARWRQVPQQVDYGKVPPSRLSIVTARRGSISYNCTIPFQRGSQYDGVRATLKHGRRHKRWCHTRGGFRTPSSTSYWLKIYHDDFDASANHISLVAPTLSIFCGFMAFFLISPKRQIPLTSLFFFWCNGRVHVGVYQKNVAPKFQHLMWGTWQVMYISSHLGFSAGPARM